MGSYGAYVSRVMGATGNRARRSAHGLGDRERGEPWFCVATALSSRLSRVARTALSVLMVVMGLVFGGSSSEGRFARGSLTAGRDTRWRGEPSTHIGASARTAPRGTSVVVRQVGPLTVGADKAWGGHQLRGLMVRSMRSATNALANVAIHRVNMVVTLVTTQVTVLGNGSQGIRVTRRARTRAVRQSSTSRRRCAPCP